MLCTVKKKVAQELLYQRWERVHSQLGSGCEDGGDDGDDDVEDDGGGTQQLEASNWQLGGSLGTKLGTSLKAI